MNQLFYGDNLQVLREHLADESVDLIYLDPPFNSKRDYNLLFKAPGGHDSEAQIEAFEDTWHWNQQALVDALVQDALYCQGLARHDLNTLLTSGYEVVSTNRTPGPLDTPQIVSIDNSVSGQLTVRGSAVLNGRMYQLQFSLDNGVTWTNANVNYTSARRMLLTPTTPGKLYLIQICALGGSTGQSAWSNPVSVMAT
jgi:hypothetical protein